MGCVAVSGCATGIGAALRRGLEDRGDRVIGIDLRGAEIEADLATPGGRRRAVEDVVASSGGRLDGLALCAGLGGHVEDPAAVASLNYFGAVDLLDGLRDALSAGDEPSALVVSSNSAQLSEEIAGSDLVGALLDHDEERARALAEKVGGQATYISTKNAVGRAVRRRAAAWGEAGVRLNAIAPGATRTPLLETALRMPGHGDAIRAFKIPLGRFGQPEEIARVMLFLLSPEASFVHGAVWYADGGSDALARPERF